MASRYGHLETVRTLVEYQADVNVKNKVRNQMMMMTLIIVLTMMMMIMMMIMIVINDDCRYAIFMIFLFSCLISSLL